MVANAKPIIVLCQRRTRGQDGGGIYQKVSRTDMVTGKVLSSIIIITIIINVVTAAWTDDGPQEAP